MRDRLDVGVVRGWSAGIELLLVLAVSAVVLVPGIGLPGLGELPVVDRDEARFAQASRQMLESDTLEGWIVPRVGDRPRLNKPPLIYWLQAGSAGLATGGDALQDAIWMYRLPSVLAALCAAGLTWWMGRRAFGNGVGLLAGLLLGTCPLVVFDAHQARADEVLLAMTTGAQVSLWWCWRTRDKPGGPSLGATALMWLFVGLGTMTKGPITPLVVCATALTLALVDRRFRWLWQLRPILGLVIVAAIVGPWLALLIRAVGWDAVMNFLDQEVVRRASSGVEGHWGPPGYHLVLLVMLFWPGSLLAAAAVIRGIRRGTRSSRVEGDGRVRRFARWIAKLRAGRDTEFFLIAWLLPSWIIFEIAGTKLPHYVLPLYPALALLVARALLIGIAALPEAQGPLARVGFGFWLVLGVGLSVAPSVLVVLAELNDWWHFDDASSPWWPLVTTSPTLVIWLAILGGVLAVIAIVIGFVRLSRGKAHQAILWSLVTVVVAQVMLLGIVLPRLAHVWISPRLIALVSHDSGVPPSSEAFPPLASQGFGEDSLVFLSRGKVEMVPDAAAFLAAHEESYVIVPATAAEEIQARTGARKVGEVRGFDYADGDAYDLTVLTTQPLGSGS